MNDDAAMKDVETVTRVSDAIVGCTRGHGDDIAISALFGTLRATIEGVRDTRERRAFIGLLVAEVRLMIVREAAKDGGGSAARH